MRCSRDPATPDLKRVCRSRMLPVGPTPPQGTVVFAGLTVVFAILGLQLSGLPSVTARATRGDRRARFRCSSRITLLPAFLGFAGRSIDKLKSAGIRERGPDHITASVGGPSLGHHPWRYLIGSLALLAVLAITVTSMSLGLRRRLEPRSVDDQRKAYDYRRGVRCGFNGTLAIVVDGATPEVLDKVTATLQADDRIDSVQAPVLNADGGVAVVTAFPTTSPQDEATEQLVKALREQLPAVVAGTDAVVLVGGNAAAVIDVSDRIPIA